MAQPVIDTLQVADALQRTGMEREQAEGFARTLGTQLGEHVAVGKDLDLGFNRISAHIDERIAHMDERFAQHRVHIDQRFAHIDQRFVQERAHIDQRFAQERAHIDQRFAKVDEQFVRIDGRFQALDERFKALDGKLNLFGALAGLALAFLGVLATLDRFL